MVSLCPTSTRAGCWQNDQESLGLASSPSNPQDRVFVEFSQGVRHNVGMFAMPKVAIVVFDAFAITGSELGLRRPFAASAAAPDRERRYSQQFTGLMPPPVRSALRWCCIRGTSNCGPTFTCTA